MTYRRLAYDDASTTAQMASDCRAVGSELSLPGQRLATEATSAPPRPDGPGMSPEALAHLVDRFESHTR